MSVDKGMPCRLNGRGPASHLASLVLLAFAAAPLESAAEPEASRSLEEEGDRWRGRAEPAYRRALEALDMAGRFAARLGDSPGEERTRRLKAGLLALLLDGRAQEGRAAGAPAAIPLTPAVPPRTAPSATGGPPEAGPSEDDLRSLASFLGEAGRAYFRAPHKEARDLAVLFECLALAERLLGDFFQARADTAYRGALAVMGEAPACLARSRLRFKLRDFEGARAELARGRLDESSLSRPEGLAFLRLQRDLARLADDRALALSVEGRLVELGEKAEEVPLPATPLPAFLRGTTADLARVARTLGAVLEAWKLEGRDLLLAELLAGQALLESGQPGEAEEALARAASHLESSAGAPGGAGASDPWLAGTLLARLGEARQRSGDPEGAAGAYRRAHAILAAVPGVEDYRGRVALELASALFTLGQLGEARALALSALSGSALAGELRVRFRLLLSGVLYLSAGSAPERLEDVLAALALADRERTEAGLPRETSEELRAMVLLQKGNVERRRAILLEARGEEGRVGAELARRQASLAAGQALAASRHAGMERLEAVSEANLAELSLEAGRPAEASELARAALGRARRLRAFETEWRALWYLARLAQLRGDLAGARATLEEAARVVEEHRLRILDAEGKAGFMAQKVALYETMAALELRHGDGPRAFLAAERARARSFVESLGLRRLLLATSPDQDLHRQYLSLLSRAEERARGPGGLFGMRDGGSYEELREKLQALRRRIRESPSASPLLRSLVDGSPAEVEEVRQHLRPEERLVEYFGAEDRVAAFVVAREAFQALVLPARRQEIESEAARFAASQAQDSALAASLGRTLLDPVLAALGPAAGPRRLIIVPFGELHGLPFEALRSGEGLLLELAEVSYLPSASVLRYLQPALPEPPRRFLALVDPDTDYDGDGRPEMPPLRGARSEVEGIAGLFPEAQVLLASQATEEACLRLAPGAEVVHLACHGEFFPSRPLDSRLYLSRGEPSDGLLRAWEVYGIDLRGSRLVALSGCETARAEVAPGDDPVGIGTAFLQAGASALLASLWKVEDRSTEVMMKTFYRKWLEGGASSRAGALREAKLALLEGGPASRPRHWAAFVLIGAR